MSFGVDGCGVWVLIRGKLSFRKLGLLWRQHYQSFYILHDFNNYLELLGQGPSGQSQFPICLGKGTGNRAKRLERVYMTSYSTLMVVMALSASVSKLQPSDICVTSILTSPCHSRSKLMAPFERASMTSYSTLMVTMGLLASVFKLQPSEICLTSILTSPGHSRSKPMAPFQRVSMTSYSTLMVTMDLSASVSKFHPSEI